jgi:hypothetical protein
MRPPSVVVEADLLRRPHHVEPGERGTAGIPYDVLQGGLGETPLAQTADEPRFRRALGLDGIGPMRETSSASRSLRCTLAMGSRALAELGTVTCGSTLGGPKPQSDAVVPAGPARHAARASRLHVRGDPPRAKTSRASLCHRRELARTSI